MISGIYNHSTVSAWPHGQPQGRISCIVCGDFYAALLTDKLLHSRSKWGRFISRATFDYFHLPPVNNADKLFTPFTRLFVEIKRISVLPVKAVKVDSDPQKCSVSMVFRKF